MIKERENENKNGLKKIMIKKREKRCREDEGRIRFKKQEEKENSLKYVKKRTEENE